MNIVKKWLTKKNYKKKLKKAENRKMEPAYKLSNCFTELDYKKHIQRFYKQKAEDINYWENLIDNL